MLKLTQITNSNEKQVFSKRFIKRLKAIQEVMLEDGIGMVELRRMPSEVSARVGNQDPNTPQQRQQ